MAPCRRPRGRRARAWLVLAALASVQLGARTARADAGRAAKGRAAPGVAWDPRWPEVRPVEYAVIVSLGALALGAHAGLGGAPRWVGRNGLDDAARSAFRLESPGGRRGARLASNVLYYGLGAYPLVVDSLLLAGLVHRRRDVAFQMLVVSAEGLLVNAAATLLVQGLARRARPHAEHCADPANEDPACGALQGSRSFWAGHVSTAFTGATLTCVHHARLPLLGGGLADGLACALPMLAATATGYLRMAGDKHWASDVAIGAGVGALSGLVLPLSLHYGWSAGGPSEKESEPRLRDVRLLPVAGASAAGLGVQGRF